MPGEERTVSLVRSCNWCISTYNSHVVSRFDYHVVICKFSYFTHLSLVYFYLFAGYFWRVKTCVLHFIGSGRSAPMRTVLFCAYS